MTVEPDGPLKRPTRRDVLVSAAVAAASAAAGPLTRPAEPIPPGPVPPLPSGRRPNIVYLLTDDQRADGMSCAGHPILRTPHMDALAAAGVRFTESFATSAICMSSRASILTGQYSRVHNIWDFGTPLPRPAFEQTYPLLLRKAGYRTGFVGKWAIGGPLPTADYDSFAGFIGHGFYFEPGRTEHLTPLQGDLAIEFLRGCKADQPFCLAISFKAPHVQDEGRDVPGIYPKYPYDHALDAAYSDALTPPPATVDERPMPAFFDTSFNLTREGPDFRAPNYHETTRALDRLLTGVDDVVGRLVATLKELGFADDTVIVYNSDHGSFYGEHGFGGKWLMLEESIRTPLIVCDPRLPHHLRGTRRSEVVLNLDLCATLLGLAGLPPPPGNMGRSLVPLVYGHPVPWRTEFFYENRYLDDAPGRPIPRSEGVRTPRWKYVRYPTVRPVWEQLFDLRADPREERNLADAAEYRAVLDAMRDRHASWGDAISACAPGTPWVEPA